jgi:hypothetical protein
MPSSRIKASWLPTRAAQSAAERWLPSTPISRRIAKVSRYSSTMQPISQQYLRKRYSWQSTEWNADNSNSLESLLQTFLFSALRPTSSVWINTKVSWTATYWPYLVPIFQETCTSHRWSQTFRRHIIRLGAVIASRAKSSCNPSPLILAFYESRFSFFLPKQKKRSHAVFRSQIQTRKVIVSNP